MTLFTARRGAAATLGSVLTASKCVKSKTSSSSYRAAAVAAVAASRRLQCSSVRSISIGTDMMSSVISLQESRPWYMNDKEGSNAAADNTVPLKELFAADKTVAVFGIPAPFTGTCTHNHYPPYQQLADELLDAGVDEIVCYSVTDPYCFRAWANSLNNDDSKIRFLADPEGRFAAAYGLQLDATKVSLGQRAERFSMLVVNGQVHNFRIVTDASRDAYDMLDDIKELNDAMEDVAAVSSL